MATNVVEMSVFLFEDLCCFGAYLVYQKENKKHNIYVYIYIYTKFIFTKQQQNVMR